MAGSTNGNARRILRIYKMPASYAKVSSGVTSTMRALLEMIGCPGDSGLGEGEAVLQFHREERAKVRIGNADDGINGGWSFRLPANSNAPRAPVFSVTGQGGCRYRSSWSSLSSRRRRAPRARQRRAGGEAAGEESRTWLGERALATNSRVASFPGQLFVVRRKRVDSGAVNQMSREPEVSEDVPGDTNGLDSGLQSRISIHVISSPLDTPKGLRRGFAFWGPDAG